MDSLTLTQLLMKDKQVKVLNTLLENSESVFTISELSKVSNVSYKTTHSLVKNLEKFGIINIEDKGASKLVSLNKNSPYIEALETLGSIDSRPLKNVAKQFAEEINETLQEVTSVVLFGSVLNGLPAEDSDIDLLVIIDSDSDPEKVEDKVWAIRDRYEREENVKISPIVMRHDKFNLHVENREPFETKVKESGKVLDGEPV